MRIPTTLNLKPFKWIPALCLTAALGTLAGCASTPEQNPLVEQARATVYQVESNPLAEQVAGDEMEQARYSLAKADLGLNEGYDLEVIEHDAYLALRHAEIAQQRIAEAQIRERIVQSEKERNMVLLEARERDADLATALAVESAREAELARDMAQMKSREAERNALEAERNALEADEARQQAAAATAAAAQLAEELDALQAEETERGLVLTLGDVLFDTDRAQLKPGAQKTLDRLAGFLNDHPDRNLLIEGHTDSTGADGYNLTLSGQRANSVRDALILRGIDPARLDAKGLGESYPVATNDSVAGRQENRRVEIVISDQDGRFGQLR